MTKDKRDESWLAGLLNGDDGRDGLVSQVLSGAAWEDIRASYWFIPSTLALGALILGFLTVWLDYALGPEMSERLALLPPAQADGARSLMTTIAQSIFGVTGVTYSVTIVAVSFASGNFGPRLIGNFMRDRVNQWSLGVLVATIVYALVVLRMIQAGDEPFVPHVAVLLALLLTLVSIAVLIYFLHHIPETIDISVITAKVGRSLVDAVRNLAETQAESGGAVFDPPDREPDRVVSLTEPGYVQAIDTAELRRIAEDNELGIDVILPPGMFATDDSAALRIWGAGVDEKVARRLRACMATGPGPTAQQNVLFLLDQLVEVSARALSPGVNDPYTAIACVNWMQAGTVAAANHEDGLTGAQSGPVRLRTVTFQDILEAGFGASRPYTSSDPLCDRHVRRVLDRMTKEIGPERYLAVLRDFIDRLDDQPTDRDPRCDP